MSEPSTVSAAALPVPDIPPIDRGTFDQDGRPPVPTASRSHAFQISHAIEIAHWDAAVSLWTFFGKAERLSAAQMLASGAAYILPVPTVHQMAATYHYHRLVQLGLAWLVADAQEARLRDFCAELSGSPGHEDRRTSLRLAEGLTRAQRDVFAAEATIPVSDVVARLLCRV